MGIDINDVAWEHIRYNPVREVRRLEGVKWDWEDYTCGFSCPCGEIEFGLTEDGGAQQCPQCGRVFVLEARVVVHEPR